MDAEIIITQYGNLNVLGICSSLSFVNM